MKNGGAPGAPVDFSTENQAENGGPRRFQVSFLGKVSYSLGKLAPSSLAQHKQQ